MMECQINLKNAYLFKKNSMALLFYFIISVWFRSAPFEQVLTSVWFSLVRLVLIRHRLDSIRFISFITVWTKKSVRFGRTALVMSQTVRVPRSTKDVQINF